MRKSKRVALSAAVLAGVGMIAGSQAYPIPAPGYETYVLYYTSAAHTTQVGARAVMQGAGCTSWHISWGVTTAYSQVFTTKCPVIVQ